VHLIMPYSPKYLEGAFSEVRIALVDPKCMLHPSANLWWGP
jgi:hypothetical protein